MKTILHLAVGLCFLSVVYLRPAGWRIFKGLQRGNEEPKRDLRNVQSFNDLPNRNERAGSREVFSAVPARHSGLRNVESFNDFPSRNERVGSGEVFSALNSRPTELRKVESFQGLPKGNAGAQVLPTELRKVDSFQGLPKGNAEARTDEPTMNNLDPQELSNDRIGIRNSGSSNSERSGNAGQWVSARLQIFRDQAKSRLYQSLGFQQPSMNSLEPRTYLDSNVIDNYLLLQTQKAGRATNIAAANVQGKIFNGKFNRYIEGKLSDYDYIFLPANPGNNHWVLFTVDVEGRSIIYQNSMAGKPTDREIESIKTYLNYLSRQQGESDVKWKFIHLKSAQQGDLHNCGVFTLMNARKRLFPNFQMPDAASAENFRGVIRNALQNEKI